MRSIKCLLLVFLFVTTFVNAREYRVVRTFSCPGATQGVAVDDNYFYAIGNQTITKYSKDTGDSLAIWFESDASIIRHFDGGIIIDGLLYCSHSNFPEVPMASSIEIIDPKAMKHLGNIPLGIEYGSCTWVVRGNNCWYAGFAHYDKSGANAGGEVLKDVSWTQIVQFDNEWRRMRGWILPAELIELIKPHSISGCLLIEGKLFCTGHDATKLFILEFPDRGMRMKLAGSIDIPFKGQGIAMDSDGFLWGISRKEHKVVKTQLISE